MVKKLTANDKPIWAPQSEWGDKGIHNAFDAMREERRDGREAKVVKRMVIEVFETVEAEPPGLVVPVQGKVPLT
jgi:hypothetical protein